MFACVSEPTGADDSYSGKQVTILYTNDEHGWMESTDTHGGAPGMMNQWRDVEGYNDDQFLILSGGDMWTGPAISTWFEGASMVDAMNEMQYTAAAIGNHEFDFEVEGLEQRQAESHFPFLSANIREKVSGEIPDFATPYVLIERLGIQFGIIGLTTTSTPWTTVPAHVADYDFISYEDALDEIVPEVLNDGAEILLVVGHICHFELLDLVPVAVQYDIIALGGGHCNELVAEVVDGVALIEGGSHLESYARLNIFLTEDAAEVEGFEATTHFNTLGAADENVASRVEFWRSQIDDTLSTVIGYAADEITRHSDEMYNMITDSWLISLPSADIALTNTGGIRQSIPAGEITLETIIGVLPFENSIVQMELTGQQLVDGLGNLVVGGMTTIDGNVLVDGSPIVLDSTYAVLTTDFLHSLPTMPFQLYDPEPEITPFHYRQPLIDWIEQLNTSEKNPLNDYLDPNPRR